MIGSVPPNVCVVDVEWVPDPETGRRLFGLSANLPDEIVREEMWRRSGATPDNPRPYLKTILCRVVSIAAVSRVVGPDGPRIELHSAPKNVTDSESSVLKAFFRFIEKSAIDPQIVGFNVKGCDLPILVQRAIVNGLTATSFCRRARSRNERDYFTRYSDWVVDLRDVLAVGGDRKGTLPEFAAACRIPAKLDMTGGDVVDRWLSGDVTKIVEYNECDALTTYLLWLEVVRFAGLLTGDEYEAEIGMTESLLRERAADGSRHLMHFLEEWCTLREPQMATSH